MLPREPQKLIRSAAHSKPSGHWIEIEELFTFCYAVQFEYVQPQSYCQVVTGRAASLSLQTKRVAFVECSPKHLTSLCMHGSGVSCRQTASPASAFRPHGFATRNTFHTSVLAHHGMDLTSANSLARRSHTKANQRTAQPLINP